MADMGTKHGSDSRGRLLRRCSTLAVAAVGAVALSGCMGDAAPEGLSGASTCDEFMHAAEQEQREVTVALAGEYGKPGLATPLGMPTVPYFCATNPDVTLDEFFAGADA